MRNIRSDSKSALREILIHDTVVIFAGTIVLLILVLTATAFASPPPQLDQPMRSHSRTRLGLAPATQPAVDSGISQRSS